MEIWFAAVWLSALTLLHAAVHDLRTATIHDLHWIIVLSCAVTYAYAGGFLFDSLPYGAVMFFGGCLLVALGKWGLGDALMLGAVSFFSYGIAAKFAFVFIVTTTAYLTLHKVLGFEKSRFMPVFFITHVIVFAKVL